MATNGPKLPVSVGTILHPITGISLGWTSPVSNPESGFKKSIRFHILDPESIRNPSGFEIKNPVKNPVILPDFIDFS